jgi:hypothetical protein
MDEHLNCQALLVHVKPQGKDDNLKSICHLYRDHSHSNSLDAPPYLSLRSLFNPRLTNDLLCTTGLRVYQCSKYYCSLVSLSGEQNVLDLVDRAELESPSTNGAIILVLLIKMDSNLKAAERLHEVLFLPRVLRQEAD